MITTRKIDTIKEEAESGERIAEGKKEKRVKRENGRKGEWENGRMGEGEKGRRGERAKGRKDERAKGRKDERTKGRKDERETKRLSARRQGAGRGEAEGKKGKLTGEREKGLRTDISIGTGGLSENLRLFAACPMP